jgi:hypothetical protein
MSENNKTTVDKKPKEDSRTKLEKLLDMKQRLEQALAFEKSKQLGEGRKADAHLKAAIGGGVLAAFENDPKMSTALKVYLLGKAEAGVQKEGLAREKFEALKAKVEKEKAAAVAAAQAKQGEAK